MKRTLLAIFACMLLALAFSPSLSAPVRANTGGDKGCPDPGSTLQKARARGRVVVGVPFDEPPFGFVDAEGRLEGIGVDIGRGLSKEIFGDADKAEFVAVASGSMTGLLRKGAIDILAAPLSVAAEEKEKIGFTVPYMLCGDLVLVEKESGITGYAQLEGKKIAVVGRMATDASFAELFPTATKVRFGCEKDALTALKRHEVQAFLTLDACAFCAEEADSDLKVVEIRPLAPMPVSMGVRKNDSAWHDFVDVVVLKMMTSGAYQSILEKWFGRVRAAILDVATKAAVERRS